MISKRVMLVGAMVIGVSYVLAIDTGDRAKSGRDAAVPGEPNTAALTAAALPQALPSDLRTGRELAALTTDMARLQSELAAVRGEQKPAAPAEPAPKSAEQLQAEHDEYMAGVEHAFDHEPRDDKWAAATSQVLRQALQHEPTLLAGLRDVECRSSSCRMEIRDDGSSIFAEELPIALHHLGAVLPEVRFGQSELGDGSQVHVMYMSKASASSHDEQ